MKMERGENIVQIIVRQYRYMYSYIVCICNVIAMYRCMNMYCINFYHVLCQYPCRICVYIKCRCHYISAVDITFVIDKEHKSVWERFGAWGML